MEMVLFANRFRAGIDEKTLANYQLESARMAELVQEMPGFVSRKVYTADDGERMIVVAFETAEAARSWRMHPEHRKAQEKARRIFYEEYSVLAGTVARSYGWRREDDPGTVTDG